MRPTTRCGPSTWLRPSADGRTWVRVSTICFGDHEFGVRALGTLSATAETALIYLLSWHLFGRQSEAIFAALLFCAMLLISAGAIIIAPDTPLGILFLVDRARTGARPHILWRRIRLVVARRNRYGPRVAVKIHGPSPWRGNRRRDGRRSQTAALVAEPDARTLQAR